MKKAGLITIAIVLVAAGVIMAYRMQKKQDKLPEDRGQGTLVKEYREWKKYYI